MTGFEAITTHNVSPGGSPQPEVSGEVPGPALLAAARIHDQYFIASAVELARIPPLDFDAADAVALEDAVDPDPIRAMEAAWQATFGNFDDPAIKQRIAWDCDMLNPDFP